MPLFPTHYEGILTKKKPALAG